jgi:hypothetical protein
MDAGSSAFAVKNNARAALIDALREDALYVENQANNDLAVLLGSGYKAVRNNRAQSPLAPVEIVSISNAVSGTLRCGPNRSVMSCLSFAGSNLPAASMDRTSRSPAHAILSSVRWLPG